METEIDMVMRHIAEGSAILAKQQRLLIRLQQAGHPTARAEQLLTLFKQCQVLHQEHLGRISG